MKNGKNNNKSLRKELVMTNLRVNMKDSRKKNVNNIGENLKNQVGNNKEVLSIRALNFINNNLCFKN